MYKKKSKKPLYYKKSKAAKHQQQENDDYSLSEESFTEPYRQPRREPMKSPKGRKREKYNKEYEYSEYGDQYERQYDYDYTNQEMYNTGEEMYEYTTEESQYQRSPKFTRPYTATETDYSEESDSDCEFCKKRRNRGDKRVTDFSEYTSEYSYREQQPRNRHMQKYGHKKQKGGSPETLDTDRSPYKKNFNVYLAHHPVGHRAFTYKQQRQLMEQEEETPSESESATEEEDSDILPKEKRQPQYQVYAAQMGQNQAGVFDQHQGRGSGEMVLSVTDYNRNVPMMALKNKTTNGAKRAQSEVVYLPVLVLDNGIKLPKSKIVSPEALMNESGEKAEKPLETNMQVYAAMDLKHGNIFEAARLGGSAVENTEPSLSKNIIYSGDQQQSSPLNRHKSFASADHQQTQENAIQFEYPVQKSYINVAPCIVRQSKGVKKVEGKPKKDKKTKQKKKTGLEKSSSLILSVVNPESHETENQHINNPKTTTINSGQNNHGNITEVIHDRKSGIDESIYGTKSRKSLAIQQHKSEDSPLNYTEPVRKSHFGEIQGNTIDVQIERKSTANEQKSLANERKSLASDRKSIAHEEKSLANERKSLANYQKSIANERKSLANDQKSIANERKSLANDQKSIANERKSLANDRKSIAHEGKSVVDENKKVLGEDRKSLTTEGEKVKREERQSTFMKSELNIQEREEIRKSIAQPIQTTESAVMPSTKKSFISKMFHRKKKESPNRVPEEPLVLLHSNTKSMSYDIPDKHDQYIIQETTSFIPATKEQSPAAKRRMSHRRKSIASKQLVEFTGETNDYMNHLPIVKNDNNSLKLWGYDLTPLIYVFQTAQFFLGLSLHDKLIEVLRTFEGIYP